MTDAPQILFPTPGERFDALGPGQYYGTRTGPPKPPELELVPVTLEQAKRLHVKTVLDALDWHMTEAGRVLDGRPPNAVPAVQAWGLHRP